MQAFEPTSIETSPHSPEGAVGYAEAATLLGVKIGTLYAWTSQRKVPHYRVGPRCVRFVRSELLAWLQSHAVSASSDTLVSVANLPASNFLSPRKSPVSFGGEP